MGDHNHHIEKAVKQANDQHKNKMGGGGTVACCTIVFLALFTAVPIAQICMGVLHKDQCPMEPWIPIFMIVGGAVSLVTIVLTVLLTAAKNKEMKGLAIGATILLVILGLFTFGWYIAGSVWVFSKWSKWDELKKAGGCYNDLYLFAFSILIIFWVCGPCGAGGGAKQRQNSGDA